MRSPISNLKLQVCALALVALPALAQFTFRDVGMGALLGGMAPPAAPAISMRNDNNNSNDGGSYLVVDWSAVPTATSYVIYRATSSGGSFTAIQTNGVVNCTDSTVSYCVNYYYKVKAVNAGGASAFSNEVTGYSVGPVSDLGAGGGAGEISLSWTMTSCSVISSVRRSADSGGPYSEIGTSNDGTFLDTGLGQNETYYYIIVENGLWGQSNIGNQASATTDP